MEEMNRAKEKDSLSNREVVESLRHQLQELDKVRLEYQMKYQSAEEKITNLAEVVSD